MRKNSVKTPDVSLGKIKIASPRDVWANEETGFTPWLVKNIDQLSKSIGFPIRVKNVEQKVGRYELDIYAENEANDSIVIIENQLEETDHKHLGQLIAYAAGLEAASVIWLSPKVLDEHRVAVEWLNRISNEQVSFFLVRMEVIQIDDSPYAVQFFLEAKPSQFERDVKRKEKKEPSVKPTSIKWSDAPDDEVAVSSWREVFVRTINRACEEGVEIKELPVKSTIDEEESQKYQSRKLFDSQTVYVEMNGNKESLQRQISNILKQLNKPKGFLHVEQEDGDVFDTPS